MAVQDYKINYKSDFVLNINGDAGWAIPFCIKFWTGMPSQAYFVGFDGVKYVNCRVGDTPTQLLVMFDDHHLPIGKLEMQIAYHTTIEEFPGSVFDEVTNARDVIVTIDGTDYQVLLDFTGEDAPELEFNLPAYANEAERIQNELQRQQNEAARIEAELEREQASAAAVAGAENVNAQLNGNTLTVTNRQGVSTSVNTKGEQGEQGPVGPEGPQGQKGVSVTGLVKTGETDTDTLYNVTFSDGTTQAIAIPKGAKGDTGATGPTGPQGPQGQTGVSITGLVKTGETETDTLYNVTFSDGTTQAVAIPKGEKGYQGPQGPVGPQGPMGDVAVITPEQQAAFTMYSTTGQNTDGPMTQKAVTDALVASSISYDNSQSGLAAENVQGALDEVDENLNDATNFILDNVFDIAAATVATNNSTYITPLKLSDGGRWTVARQDAATGRIGHITIPELNVGKTYKISFEYTSTLTTIAAVKLCRFTRKSGQNVIVDIVSSHGTISAGSSGEYTFEFTYDATTTRYLGFLFTQPVTGRLIEIHDLNICEICSVKDAVQKLIDESIIQDSDDDSDLDIEDEDRNVLVRFANGHVQTKNFDSSQVYELATKNNENFDFTIEDETGDAIVLFQRGHIRTKNFNSETFSAANYLKDKFQGKKIAIIGDSISTYQGWLPSDVSGFSGTTYETYYPHGDVNSVDKTWWYQVAQNLGIPAADIANTAWSGSKACGDSTSTTNGHAGCSTKRINDIAIHGYVPDIIIVYIGCNDWYQCGLQGYNVTLGTWAITDAIPAEGTINAFRSAYALMLSKIQNAYPNSRIFCCTILDDWRRDGIGDDDSDNAWPSNDGAGYTTKQWNDNIKEIADAFACDVIDLHNCGITYFNIQQHYAVDAGLHPNAAGHALMARKVTSELMAKY